MIGIQAGAVSFVDEGTERVLDNFQRLGDGQHDLSRDVHVRPRHRRTTAARAARCPTTASRSTTTTFTAATSRRRTRSTTATRRIAPEKAPDHPDYDVIADVLPAAHKRGMKVICWFEDVIGANVPGFDKAREVTLTGRPSTFACSRNPNTRNFWLGMVEDYLRSYDVDGLMWGSERQGPLGNALVANHGGVGRRRRHRVFLSVLHRPRRRSEGIDVDRAKRRATCSSPRW